MAYTYSDQDDQYSDLRLQILHFIRYGHAMRASESAKPSL